MVFSHTRGRERTEGEKNHTDIIVCCVWVKLNIDIMAYAFYGTVTVLYTSMYIDTVTVSERSISTEFAMPRHDAVLLCRKVWGEGGVLLYYCTVHQSTPPQITVLLSIPL